MYKQHSPNPIPLCKHHYHDTYKHLQPQQSNCSTCEISLKHVNNRVFPEPKVIEAHLRNTAGFEGTISTGDKVCFSCYKSHLIILQNDKKINSDSHLQLLLQNTRVLSTSIPTTAEEINDHAMDKTLIDIGEDDYLGVVYPYWTNYNNWNLQRPQIDLLLSC